MTRPLVSIVVTTRNEERNIVRCLSAIRAQTWRDQEIIVVDNHSDDSTCALAAQFTPHVFTFGPERSSQRNHGMLQRAAGEYVMYLDADMMIAPGLVAACVAWMETDPACSGIFVPEIILGRSAGCAIRRFERSFYDGTVVDAVRFIRRDAMQAAGGFDEKLSGPEDWDLDKKLKAHGTLHLLSRVGPAAPWNSELSAYIRSTGVEPDAGGAQVLYHDESRFDLKRYLAKKTYYAGSFDGYVTRWGKNDPDVRRQLGAAYRFFGVFLEAGRWRKLVAHPLLTAGMYGLRFLVGVNYLRVAARGSGLNHDSYRCKTP